MAVLYEHQEVEVSAENYDKKYGDSGADVDVESESEIVSEGDNHETQDGELRDTDEEVGEL